VPAAPDPKAPEADDPTLVRRAQEGDRVAFETLYRRHVGRIHGLCRRLADDAGGAEELVQEAFLLAWRKLASFRGDSAFGSWLYRLTLNHALSIRRAEQREAGRVLSYDASFDGRSTGQSATAAGHAGAAGEGVPTGASPTDRLAHTSAPRADLAVDLERAIATLPGGARTVFVLADVYGHAHEEIARLLGIAPGTSKAQLHRARMLLRKALSR
jgi:RNA polymerase sigma-70 factor (ECF subfamily)